MNNKGFTLVELVGIVLVLAAIFLVSFPSFLNMAKEDEEKNYDEMINNLCLAGETFIYSNIEDFPKLNIVDSEIELQIEELITYGTVKNNTINPKTKEKVNDDSLEYKVLSDKSLECKYIDK